MQSQAALLDGAFYVAGLPVEPAQDITGENKIRFQSNGFPRRGNRLLKLGAPILRTLAA